jgi:hypothetical protein
MTFSRIVLAIIAVPIAWRFGPALLSFIGSLLPVFGWLLSFLMPDFGSTTIDQIFRFLLTLVLFWLIFRGFGVAFGFLAPKAQQFSTTKLVRRLQGVVAELAVLAGLFFITVGLAAFWVPWQNTPSGRARVEEVERYQKQKQEIESNRRKENEKEDGGKRLVDIYKEKGEWKLERETSPPPKKEPLP